MPPEIPPPSARPLLNLANTGQSLDLRKLEIHKNLDSIRRALPGLSSALTDLKNSCISVEDWNERIEPLFREQIKNDQKNSESYILNGEVLSLSLTVMLAVAILLHPASLLFLFGFFLVSGLSMPLVGLSFLAGYDEQKRSCDLEKIIATAQRQLNPSQET